MIIVAKSLKPFLYVAVGSQANIGASAPIVAFSPFSSVGVLLAVLGYAVRNLEPMLVVYYYTKYFKLSLNNLAW
jgi:uncharacterized membrane protein